MIAVLVAVALAVVIVAECLLLRWYSRTHPID